jgi:tetratricopeptide (TPR) repeat protein
MKKLIFTLVVVFSVCTVAFFTRETSADGAGNERVTVGARNAPPLPKEPFSPSNARTEDGKLITVKQFIPAARCASCHRDTHAAWAESLHRNAGREPFYKESVDILQRTRGIEFTRHCEACHAPVALLSGALTTGSKEPRTFDDEGVSCMVCHSITEARNDGTGSYTIRQPALLEREDGTPIYGDQPDAAILADVPAHRRAMMRPLLKTPEFCSTCHKSVAPPELNNYKFLRGFSAYDEWQQSGASKETVTPFYRRERRADCRSCHMSPVESSDDRAAKKGMIASHRWLGANTAAPLFYGQKKQVEETIEFLKDGVLSVDIFALKREATGELIAPLDARGRNRISAAPGEEIVAEVVIANRKAAHSFPPELRDMYEPWVEFEAVDDAGTTIFHSGFVRPDKTLDESAHVYKSILLDYEGRPLTRHQVWAATAKAYDNFINAGRSDIARFCFRVPQNGKATSITLRARVNYRRFIQEYTDYVLRKRGIDLTIPVVRMAEAEVKLDFGDAAPLPDSAEATNAKKAATPDSEVTAKEARRWNDYGIGLLEQVQYGAAAEAFRHAAELNPKDQNLLVNAAIAELRTEQYGLDRGQIRKAAALLDAALAINPTDPRILFFHAIVLRGEGKLREAADVLEKVSKEFPRDREVQRQLGQMLYSLGRLDEARAAFEAVLAIDPNDAGAYQFLSPLYASAGRMQEASRANSLYLLWRDDPLADSVAARFFTANLGWTEERVWSHTHRNSSLPRPTLTGPRASPDE